MSGFLRGQSRDFHVGRAVTLPLHTTVTSVRHQYCTAYTVCNGNVTAHTLGGWVVVCGTQPVVTDRCERCPEGRGYKDLRFTRFTITDHTRPLLLRKLSLHSPFLTGACQYETTARSTSPLCMASIAVVISWMPLYRCVMYCFSGSSPDMCSSTSIGTSVRLL